LLPKMSVISPRAAMAPDGASDAIAVGVTGVRVFYVPGSRVSATAPSASGAATAASQARRRRWGGLALPVEDAEASGFTSVALPSMMVSVMIWFVLVAGPSGMATV
jgi:hypothetical protein